MTRNDGILARAEKCSKDELISLLKAHRCSGGIFSTDSSPSWKLHPDFSSPSGFGFLPESSVLNCDEEIFHIVQTLSIFEQTISRLDARFMRMVLEAWALSPQWLDKIVHTKWPTMNADIEAWLDGQKTAPETVRWLLYTADDFLSSFNIYYPLPFIYRSTEQLWENDPFFRDWFFELPTYQKCLDLVGEPTREIVAASSNRLASHS